MQPRDTVSELSQQPSLNGEPSFRRGRWELAGFALLTLLVAASLFVGTALVVRGLLGSDDPPDPVTFSSEAWASARPGNEKHGMAITLVSERRLEGLTLLEVTGLLGTGRPASRAGTDAVAYNIDTFHGGNYDLIVRFSGGLVVGSEIRKVVH